MSFFDKAIAKISPAWALKRSIAQKQYDAFTGITASVPYDQAYQTRVDSYWSLSLSMTGIREINRFNLRRMRDRARHLERTNVFADAILTRLTESIIGDGMRLQPSTADEDFNKAVIELWNSQKDKLDITGRYDFAQWQRMKYRSCIRDGDVGTVLVSNGPNCYLQTISGDYIDSLTTALLDNASHVHGMELGRDGDILKYHIKYADDDGQWQNKEIPARNFIFYARNKQLTDYRGEPVFAQIFTILEQMEKYTEAEIIKKRIEACQALFIRTETAVQGFSGLQNTTAANTQTPRAGIRLEPGLVEFLRPGEDVTNFTPSHNGQDFSQLMKTLSGYLGIHCGLTVNQLLLDYEGMSFSSAKAAQLQSQRHFRVEQHHFSRQVLDRVYHWWISKQVKNGVLTVPPAIVNSYWSHTWVPPAFPLLDPNKEIVAQMAEIDSGLSTYSDISLSRGHDFRDICKRRQQDDKLLAEAGIKPSRSMLTRDPLAPPTGNSISATGPAKPANELSVPGDEDEEDTWNEEN